MLDDTDFERYRLGLTFSAQHRAPASFSAEGHKSTLFRWREESGEDRVIGAIAGTVSDGPRLTRSHRSSSAHGRRTAETNGYPLTALRGQVCGLNWRTLKGS